MNRVTISPDLAYFLVVVMSTLFVYSAGITLIALTLGETINSPAFAEELCKKGTDYDRV